jgi:hypothetical protein
MREDGFSRLVELHRQLVKAGQGSLRAAYEFGGVVNELHDTGYSYAVLGEAVSLGAAQISVYAKLFRKYSTIGVLLSMSEALGSYSVNLLASDGETAHYAYLYRCENCGSDKVKRERAPEVPVSPEVAQHQAAAKA